MVSEFSIINKDHILISTPSKCSSDPGTQSWSATSPYRLCQHELSGYIKALGIMNLDHTGNFNKPIISIIKIIVYAEDSLRNMENPP